MPRLGAFQPDDEVRLEIVRLAVVKVGDRETKPGILDEGINRRAGVDQMTRAIPV